MNSEIKSALESAVAKQQPIDPGIVGKMLAYIERLETEHAQLAKINALVEEYYNSTASAESICRKIGNITRGQS